jgi:threonine/homoserine efflux transporter RhtA
MSLKKVFIWFSVAPVVIAELNRDLTSISFFPWAHEKVNQIGWVALAIAGINCLYILYRNYKTEKSFGWYVFATFMAIVFFGYLWFAYQLSKAGF